MPRAKTFNPDVVVDKAMRTFWETGYEATSVQRLVDATGINRFSMYQTFGDKRGLFRHALDHYYRDVLARIVALSGQADRGLESIRLYFEALATTLTSSIGKLGCLGQNTGIELALRDSEAVAPLRDMYDTLAGNFERALEKADKHGQIVRAGTVSDIPRFLVTIAQGMILMARTSGDHHYIRSSERQVYAFLDYLAGTDGP
ncbi:MAG: TetR/AcrR family transcriptional regulator [Rhodothermales bacterium]|nr:TetR/AcrR family transcriptional regulator [Rhodothermales bacterium]